MIEFKARKSRPSDELARSMFAGQIGRMWQTYAKVAHEDNPHLSLNAEEFRQFAMDRYELDIRDAS